MNKLNLLQKCKDCSIEFEFNTNRQYCESCAETRKKNQYKNHKRKAKTRLIYGQMFINLTKNYVYFVEGLK